ncbi:MAG: GGDEF and EAL domain-containing protein [Fibrobacteraceae bacterium]|nr:GGDEF and EAL domain-containing protein [Fibrobacteraceae bacterium]
MKLFDEHVLLRFLLLVASVLISALLYSCSDGFSLKEFVVVFSISVLCNLFLLYVALFYGFPRSNKEKKIRNDVGEPQLQPAEPSRDYKKDYQEKNELFQMMIDVSAEGFWTFDVPTGKVFWSKKVAQLLGVDPSQIDDSFELLRSRVVTQDWDAFRVALNEIFNQKSHNFSITLRLLHKQDVSFMISGRVQCGEDGRPIRVIGALSEKVDRKILEKRNSYYDYQDALTGLGSRRFFLEKLKVDIDVAAQRPDYVFGVALIDIDSFGAINDSYSISVGDDVLRIVGERIKSSCGEYDFCARIDPDVFAVLFHGVKSSDPNLELQNIVSRMHGKIKMPIQIDGKELYISASMAVVLSKDVDCVEDVLASANVILRDLKKSGTHGGVQFFTGGVREKAMKLYRMEVDIRKAIQANEFMLMYQPIVDIQNGDRLVGFEALVRWNSAERGIISPADFIPLAEETGLIVPMGALILRMACEQTKKWVDMGFKDICVSVNFSAKQFALDSMKNDIMDVLNEVGLNPHNLKMEVTEYTAMCEAEKTLILMKELTDLGLRISIDDFGTGYSSLSYLKRYPVHTLKMDKSFIDHVTDDEEDAAFARMVIGIARSMNLDLIAEGVETRAQMEFLKREGCRNIQGFYFSKPLSPEDALEYMKAHYADEPETLPNEIRIA